MKTIKQISRIFLAAIILAISVNGSFAQERKESLEKSFILNSTGNFAFSCYDTDLKVNTWQKGEVKLTGEIIIEGGDKEDQDELIDLFRNPEVSQSTNSLNIETKMAKSTIGIAPFMSITLVNGKKINIDKFKVTYTLWVPESIAFDLKSKYNNIEIANLTGKLNFDLYDVDLTILNFGSDSKINMKYSNASMGKCGTAKLNIYDCDLEIKELNKGTIESKYSDFIIENASTLNIKSYDDDFNIETVDILTIDAKYSDLEINSNMTKCAVTFYDSDITAKNITDLKFSGKYSSIDALDVSKVEVTEIYDSNIELGEVGIFSCLTSKYDEFKFNAITKSIYMPETYTSVIEVLKVESGFKSFEGSFKYGSVDLPMGSDVDYDLEFEITYGNVDYPKERFKSSSINVKENSKHTFKGSTNQNAACKVQFKAYSTKFNLE